MGKKIILTGATGYVGEGVLIECLAHPQIDEVLVIGRAASGMADPKLKEVLVKDFLALGPVVDKLRGYDACFYCAGISSVGMKEEEYVRVTYDSTIELAKAVLSASPGIQFNYVSGAATDSSEQGRNMWARVKGRTENEIGRLGFKQSYNFRPGIIKPSPGQRNPKTYQRILVPLFALILPGSTCRMEDLGLAMINSLLKGYSKRTLEVKDIKVMAKG